jgi:hypothetical protein
MASIIGSWISCPWPVRYRVNNAIPTIDASIAPGQLVDHDGGEVARRPVGAAIQGGDAGHALDQFVVGRELLHGAAFLEAAGGHVDQLRVAGGLRGIVRARAAGGHPGAYCRRRCRPSLRCAG